MWPALSIAGIRQIGIARMFVASATGPAIEFHMGQVDAGATKYIYRAVINDRGSIPIGVKAFPNCPLQCSGTGSRGILYR